MIRIFTVLITSLLASCQVAPEAAEQATHFERSQFENWGRERIQLPPGFAPALPAGSEFLLFAPGMFDPEAEDYWTYAFVMQLEQTNLNVKGLDQLFELYYDGLILAVAGDRDVGPNPAEVHVAAVGDGLYEASVFLIDAFTTMEPVDLRLLIQAEPNGATGSLLRVQASPQPAEHEVWKALGYLARTMSVLGLVPGDAQPSQ